MMCNLLPAELLEIYQAMIVRIEKEVLAQQAPSLQAISVRLQQMQVSPCQAPAAERCWL
jgi:hypothetical protein